MNLPMVDCPVESGVSRLGVFGVDGSLPEPDQPLSHQFFTHRGCNLKDGVSLLVHNSPGVPTGVASGQGHQGLAVAGSTYNNPQQSATKLLHVIC